MGGAAAGVVAVKGGGLDVGCCGCDCGCEGGIGIVGFMDDVWGCVCGIGALLVGVAGVGCEGTVAFGGADDDDA